MEEHTEKKDINEDISKEIETSYKEPEVVTKEIAEEEENISKAVSVIPIAKDELEERKRKIINFLKQKKDWIFYVILSFIVFLSVYIRTRNIPKLKDITTNDWTLGPDLDPFLFLRWAKYIVENGNLMVSDVMRNVPLGHNTAAEMKLLPYMIVWFHDISSFFTGNVSVTYSAIIFPVFMAALTAIAFFLFARKIFYKENKMIRNTIALISTALFVVIPSMLPRTIAGIPEKESAAFFFMFMAFYLFLEAFTSNNLRRGLIFGVLSGLATAGIALIWGGAVFVFLTIPVAVLLAHLLGKVDMNKIIIYVIWVITTFAVAIPFSERYNLKNLVGSLSTGLAIGVFILISISLILIKSDKLNKLRRKLKFSKEIFYFIISISILIILILIFLGPSFIISQIKEIQSSLITPISDRFSMTVAENRQPYFASEWKGNFGPIKFNIPLYFWLFFIGSVTLFNNLIKRLGKKERIILTFSYFIFLICLIFSRYSPSSKLDGVSGLSLLVYFGGWLFFIGSLIYFYHKRHMEGSLSIFKEFNFSYILYFIILTLGIIGARGGIRLIMVLGAISPIAVAFLIVKASQRYFKEKDDIFKLLIGIVAIIIIISSIYTFWIYYKSDKTTAENFAPGAYQMQWQKAMSWVRENTSQDAVFAHWWDYGYWLQSIGERATILDGGNAIAYWNHLMGRHVLTGADEQKALEFLYAHDGTHLLIDSTEIGKYTAYSSIGSDKDYDRFSWISTFIMNDAQTQETNNKTIYLYSGGSVIDEDTIIKEDGKEILLPKKAAGVGAIILKKDQEGNYLQPEVIFVYNQKQYNEELRYAYIDDELHDFGSGLDAGIFVFPSINTNNGGMNINNIGAAFYLSPRTIHSHLANLYLFDQSSEYFKLVHTESNLFIENIKQQGVDIGDFVYYQGFQGPIKIWEIDYPSDIELNQDYLETQYPEEIRLATSGEYN